MSGLHHQTGYVTVDINEVRKRLDIFAQRDLKEYIKIEDCLDGYTYFINARNSRVGIYKASDRSFIISRFKFGHNYLFDEYHWDTGSPHGTVKPIQIIEKRPAHTSEDDTLKYLNGLSDKYGLIKE